MIKLINPLSLKKSEKKLLYTFFKSNLTKTLMWKANTVYTSSDGQDFQLEYPVFWRFQELRPEENKELIRNNKKQPKKNTMPRALKGIRLEVIDNKALGESKKSVGNKIPKGVFKIRDTLVIDDKDKTLISKNALRKAKSNEERFVKCSVFDAEKYDLIAKKKKDEGKEYDLIAAKRKGWQHFLELSFNGYELSQKTEHLVVKRPIIDSKEGFCLQISNNEGPDYFNVVEGDQTLGGKKLSIEQRFEDTINFVSSVRRQITDKGIIHRDIKPENVAVDPVTRRMTVIDMELSIKQGLWDGMWVGTPGYRSPESYYLQKIVVQREEQYKILVTEQTDVYSVGEAIKKIWRGFGFIDYSKAEVIKAALFMENGLTQLSEMSERFFVTDTQFGTDDKSIFSELPKFIKKLLKITIKVMLLPDPLKRITLQEAENLFKDLYQLYKYNVVNPIPWDEDWKLANNISQAENDLLNQEKQPFHTVRKLVNDSYAQWKKQSGKEAPRQVGNESVLEERKRVKAGDPIRSKSLFFAKLKDDQLRQKPELFERVAMAP